MRKWYLAWEVRLLAGIFCLNSEQRIQAKTLKFMFQLEHKS